MSILVLTSDTLIGTPATGNLEYNGQFFGTDSNASRAQMQRITQGTAVASTSGTSIDFTGIPAWVKRITVMFVGVSTSGTSPIQIQIGNGSPETSGYLSGAQTAGSAANITSGFSLEQSCAATSVRHGMAFISTLGSNVWSYSTITNRSDTTAISWGSGSKTTSATLDRVRITTVNGTDTFDAGTINLLYEG